MLLYWHPSMVGRNLAIIFCSLRLKVHYSALLQYLGDMFWKVFLNYQISSITVDLTSLLTCVRIARSQGVIKAARNADDSQWNNLIPVDVLKQGLCHSSDHVRSDVFSLLCECLKTTEPIKEQELELMRFFIQDNLTSQSPAFRQSIVSAFKKVSSVFLK